MSVFISSQLSVERTLCHYRAVCGCSSEAEKIAPCPCAASCLLMVSGALSQLPFLLFLPFLSLSFVSWSPSSVFFPSIFPSSVLPFFPDLSVCDSPFPSPPLPAYSLSSVGPLVLLPCVLFLFLPPFPLVFCVRLPLPWLPSPC